MIRESIHDLFPVLRRIRRKPSEGFWAGVCAGLADFLSVDPKLVRFIWFFGALMTGLFPFVIVYLALWYLTDPEPAASTASHPFGNFTGRAPSYEASALRDRFARLEERLRSLEACVSSREFQLRREFEDL
ncbi:MAG: PspC domain-containing protein [Gammaproteobacteria bacterium]|nr:PspC domain-containing protein [Gammaproteobacteria bacterium]